MLEDPRRNVSSRNEALCNYHFPPALEWARSPSDPQVSLNPRSKSFYLCSFLLRATTRPSREFLILPSYPLFLFLTVVVFRTAPFTLAPPVNRLEAAFFNLFLTSP